MCTVTCSTNPRLGEVPQNYHRVDTYPSTRVPLWPISADFGYPPLRGSPVSGIPTIHDEMKYQNLSFKKRNEEEEAYIEGRGPYRAI